MAFGRANKGYPGRMERYKLIREYPGSPPKDTVVYHPHWCPAYRDKHFKVRNTGKVKNYIFFDEQDVKGYPQNWKKL